MTIGRVTNNLLQMSTLGDVRLNNQSLLELQKRLTTGRQINNISDDPLGVNRVLDYDQTISQNEQFVKNLDNGRSELGITDNSLDGLHALINRAKSLTLSQINGTATEFTRDATAVELSQILQQIVTVANTQIGDSFVFAGSNATKIPFEKNGDEVVYSGDSEDRVAAISQDVFSATNIPGSRTFGIFKNQIESAFNLTPSLQDKVFIETEIESSNLPNGFTFSLKDAPTENIIGKELIITRGQNQGVSVRILDYDSATKAVKIETQKFPISLVNGTKLAIVQAPTRISELNAGKGITLGKFIANVGANSYTIDISKADNISDVKEIIENTLNGAVKVEFKPTGQGLSITNLTNDSVTFLEDGRGIVARELGLLDVGNSRTLQAGETILANDITPLITRNTMLSSLNGNAGISNLGFRILNGAKEHIFDTDDIEGLSTVGDLLNIINTSNLSVDADINADGTGISIRSRLSGKGVSIDNVMAKGEITEVVSANQYKLDSSAYLSDPEGLIGTQILITNIDGTVESRVIENYDGSIMTLDLPANFSAGAQVEIFSSRRFLGSVKSSTSNSFSDPGAFKNTKNIMTGGILKITEGKNAGSTLRITSSDDDTIYFNNPNNLNLDDSSAYEIITGTANALGLNSFNTGATIDSIQESRGVSLDEFEITYGPGQVKTTVDVSKAKNFQDIIDAIGRATNNTVVATLVNGNAIKLEDSRSTAILQNTITINDIGSSTTAKDLGLIGVDGQAGKEYIGSDLKVRVKEVNIFTALYDAINGLRENDLTRLNLAGQEIDTSINNILDARAEVGARLNRFDLSKNRLEDQNIFLKELRSNTLDADYIDTVFQFNNRKDVLDASLKAVGALLKTSLLDYI